MRASLRIFALSFSSEYTRPSFTNGGQEDFDVGEMNDFRRDHHCFEDNESNLSLLASESVIAFFESLIKDVVSFRRCLKRTQSIGKFVLLLFCMLFYVFGCVYEYLNSSM